MHQMPSRLAGLRSARLGASQCKYSSTVVRHRLVKPVQFWLMPARPGPMWRLASSRAVPHLLSKAKNSSSSSDALDAACATFNETLKQLQSDRPDVQTFTQLVDQLVYLKYSRHSAAISKDKFNAIWVSLCNDLLKYAPDHISTMNSPGEFLPIIRLFLRVRRESKALSGKAVAEFDGALERKLLSSDMVCKFRETYKENKRVFSLFSLIDANLTSSRPAPLLKQLHRAVTSNDDLTSLPTDTNNDVNDSDGSSDNHSDSRNDESVSEPATRTIRLETGRRVSETKKSPSPVIDARGSQEPDDGDLPSFFTTARATFKQKFEVLQSNETDIQTFCELTVMLVNLKGGAKCCKTVIRDKYTAMWANMCNDLLTFAPAHVLASSKPKELVTVINFYLCIRSSRLPRAALKQYSQALQQKLATSEVICMFRERQKDNRAVRSILRNIGRNLKAAKPPALLPFQQFYTAVTSNTEQTVSPTDTDNDVNDSDGSSDNHNDSRSDESVSEASSKPETDRNVLYREGASPTLASNAIVSSETSNSNEPCFSTTARATFKQKFEALQSNVIDVQTFCQLADLLMPLKFGAKRCKTVSKDEYNATWASMCKDLVTYAPAHIYEVSKPSEFLPVIDFYFCIRSSIVKTTSPEVIIQYSQALLPKLASSEVISMFRERQHYDGLVRHILASIERNLKGANPALLFHDFYQAVNSGSKPTPTPVQTGDTDDNDDGSENIDKSSHVAKASSHTTQPVNTHSPTATTDDLHDSHGGSGSVNGSGTDGLVPGASDAASKTNPVKDDVQRERSASPTPAAELSVSKNDDDSWEAMVTKVYVTAPEPAELTQVVTLKDVTDYLVQLCATLQEQLAGKTAGEVRLVSLKSAKAYQMAVSNALQKAAELWRGEPLPDMHDIELLTAMLGQSSEDGPAMAMNMSNSDDEGSDTEAAALSSEDEEPEDLQEIENEDEEEEEEEEGQLTEEQIEAFNLERDGVVDAAGDVLVSLTGPEEASVMISTLWSLIALDVKAPLSKRSTAWSQWVNWTSARLDRARPQDGKWLLNDIGDEGLVPSLLLAIRVLQINKISLQPLAQHVLTHMGTDAWRAEAVSAAVESLWAMLQPSKPEQEQLSLQLVSGFDSVIKTAHQRDLKEGTNSVLDITAWYVSRAPSGYRDMVCKTLIKAIRNVAADRGLFITQLAVSQFTDVEEESMDKEEIDKLYGYIRSMVRAVYSRAKVVIGIGANAQGGLASFTPSQLVQLAELNVLHAQHLTPEPQDKELMEEVCKALRGRVPELGQDVQALFVMARVLTDSMYKDEPLIRSIIDRATAVTKTLDPDTLAECVYSQTGGGKQLDSNNLRLFNITVREAMAKLHNMSVSGLIMVLVGISRLSSQDLLSFQHHVDRIVNTMIVKLDGTGKPKGRLGVFTYPNQIAAAADSLNFMKHYHPGLLQRLALSVSTTEQASKLTMLQVVKLLTTLSVLAYDMPETTKTFRACAQRIATHAGSLRPFILVKLCWAYAVANQNPRVKPSRNWLEKRAHLVGITNDTKHKVTLAHILLAELITRDKWNDPTLNFIVRIWGTSLAGQVEIPKSMWLHVKKLAKATSTSDTQRQLMTTLKGLQRELGLGDFKMEAHVGDWVVDILATHKKSDKRIVFEVDGPVHFVRNVDPKDPRVLGNTHIRNVCLERQGVKLITIPYIGGQRGPSPQDLKDLVVKAIGSRPRASSRR